MSAIKLQTLSVVCFAHSLISALSSFLRKNDDDDANYSVNYHEGKEMETTPDACILNEWSIVSLL